MGKSPAGEMGGDSREISDSLVAYVDTTEMQLGGPYARLANLVLGSGYYLAQSIHCVCTNLD